MPVQSPEFQFTTVRLRAVWLRLIRVIPLVVVAIVVASCQARVDVATTVHDDGSGTVVVGIGLDDGALDRVGDIGRQLRTDDLAQAGWNVDGPVRGDDGFTWVKAAKDFTEPSQVGPIMAELTGPDGVFRDFRLTRKSSWRGTNFDYEGQVDLTKGPAVFSDPQLADALGGDPFGGTLQAIEEAEGKSVAEMVSFRVSVDLPGKAQPAVWTPGLDDPEPTSISLQSSQGSSFSGLAPVAAGAVVVAGFAAALVVLRRVHGARS